MDNIKMEDKKYRVVFTQYYVTEVEARNEDKAIFKAEENFYRYASRPVAHTEYDEVTVEEITDEVLLIPGEEEEEYE